MPPPSEENPRRPMKVLSVGLPRTGSASMAQALTILGYQNVYHTLYHIDTHADWRTLNRACDASFPNLPSYRGYPFSQSEWDDMFGPCEAATDAVSMFGPQVVQAYPEAKVVLVVRDFDKWFKSVDEGLLSLLWRNPAALCIDYVEPFLGLESGSAVRKMFLGLFRAADLDECRRNARASYDRYHQEVRDLCGPGRLLEYRLGEGWGPLCEFLDLPVPEEEFPWTNEAKALRAVVVKVVTRRFGMAAAKGLPWLIGAGAVGLGAWMQAKRKGLFA